MNKITEPLQSLIMLQSGFYSNDIRNTQISLKSKIKQLKSSNFLSAKAELPERAPANLKRSVELALEKGASNWVTVLPWQKHGFSLHKTASMMLLLFDMVGILLDFPSTVLVMFSFLLNIHFLVRKGAFPLLDLMRFVI